MTYMAVFRILFFLVPVVAWAQPAVAPPVDPPVQDLALIDWHLKRAIDILKTQPQVSKPTVTSTPTSVSIPAEIRDAVLSLCGILITAGIGAGLTWMRSHFAFMKEASANAAITSSAQGLGALLEQALAKQGKSLSTVEISDPTVAVFARKLITSYPEWGPLVGLTQDIAERKVLGGAIEQSSVPIVAAPAVSPETRSQMIAATAEMLRPKPPPSPPGQPIAPTVTPAMRPGTVS